MLATISFQPKRCLRTFELLLLDIKKLKLFTFWHNVLYCKRMDEFTRLYENLTYFQHSLWNSKQTLYNPQKSTKKVLFVSDSSIISSDSFPQIFSSDFQNLEFSSFVIWHCVLFIKVAFPFSISNLFPPYSGSTNKN